MRKKNDDTINMGKVMSASMSFEKALSDYSTEDIVLSKISHLAGGCSLISEFIIENKEHFENVENTNNVVEIILGELAEIKEEIKSIKQELRELD